MHVQNEVYVDGRLAHESNRWRDDVMFTECIKEKDEQDGEMELSRIWSCYLKDHNVSLKQF